MAYHGWLMTEFSHLYFVILMRDRKMKAKSMFFRPLLCLLFLLPTAACPATTGKIIYVDDNAVGLNDGSSWQNAYTFLQDALADANSAEKPVEIRIAQGIYKTDQGANQTPGE